ncbi:MAG TPA: hypothetical protein VNK47_12405 [Candidatus Dormibacteraeota bacterium]|nr:hypothetical protein [Candidatus Dormibacteraeota bacterium]
MGLFRLNPQKLNLGLAMCALAMLLFLPSSPRQIVAARDETPPTFSKDVAPILFKHCATCHGTGELASKVPLVSYDDAHSRAEKIKQKVIAREMPPWPADPAKSLKFRNDARLSQHDIDTIVAWVNAGSPKGNDADLPAMPKSDDGWNHPLGLKPDLVISLPGTVDLPAKGAIPYVRSLVQVPFSDDKWIAASQTRAGNPAVVHHMAITEIALPSGMSSADLDQLTVVARRMGIRLDTLVEMKTAVVTPSRPEQPDMLGIYTPGSTFEMYSGRSAKLLRGGKNMYLVFNIHYETTGKPESDRSKVAFWFAPGPPEHQMFRVNGAGETIIANGKELLTDDPGIKAEGTHVVIPPIPAFAHDFELTGVTGYPEPVTLYQFQPHAHHRGKDFLYTVVYPDGHEQPVLSVPKYDHRWQMAYELETPLKLPAGSKLVVTAHYDNSTMNMHNPAPEKAVYFRDQNQSWDEMFTPFVQYSIDDQVPSKPSSSTATAALQIGEVVGCVEASTSSGWLLTKAREPVISDTQATSSAELKAAEESPSGTARYQLLGASVFKPLNHQKERVVVKGILIRDARETRINVTSLQSVAAKCGN